MLGWARRLFTRPEAAAAPMAMVPFSFGSMLSHLWSGEKYPGGYDPNEFFGADYWTMRARSASLFKSNLYARGLVRRIVTNEINMGLSPEVNPDEEVLGLAPGTLEPWSDMTEARYSLWANSAELCDISRMRTFAEIQEQARIEALIEGDVLVNLVADPVTGLPRVQLVEGQRVRTSLAAQAQVKAGERLEEGVLLSTTGEHLAFFLEDGTRLEARGANGRLKTWLFYGTERRTSAVRGEPLLILVAQSLKEVDRYRDASQRKAAVNATLAMFIKKTQNTPGSLPITGGAQRKTSATAPEPTTGRRSFGAMPGTAWEELAHGEEPVLLGGQGTDTNFGAFEAVVIAAVAWANEVPPEILMLSFEKNYSASQAAINEFKNYISKRWKRTGDTLCKPIYVDWLIAEALSGKHNTPGLLESMRDPLAYDIFAALTAVDWYGNVKPSTDFLKASRGAQVAVQECWSTNSREARGLTGADFMKNCKRVARENRAKVEAWAPLAEFFQKFGGNLQQLSALMGTTPPPEEETQDDAVGD